MAKQDSLPTGWLKVVLIGLLNFKAVVFYDQKLYQYG